MELNNKQKWFRFSIGFHSLLCFLFWLALRVNYAGISKQLGADTNQSFFIIYLPVIFLFYMGLVLLISALQFLFPLENKFGQALRIILIILNLVNTVLNAIIVLFGAYDYLYFILPKFFNSLAFSILMIILGWLMFTEQKRTKFIKVFVIVSIIITTFIISYHIKGNSISTGAVVYAVEDDYQIVFSTSNDSLAWVIVDGVEYYDLYAGSMRSKDHVHKIVVPQEALDKAKGYTINVQEMIYRGPFGGFKGKVISQEYLFKPVDSSDGISYVALSDVHHCLKGAVNSAKSAGEIDFLVLLGDLVGMVEYPSNANFANVLAYEITKGEIPVVYVRGNHEIKGKEAEDFYKYVGSKDQKFYYTFTLSNIYGIVLDIGEDHDDDWWEYYDTSKFQMYRDEQSRMLEEIIESKENKEYDYTLVLCHIPITFVNRHRYHEDSKIEWTKLLNEIGVDMALYGHQHDLCQFVPGLIEPEKPLTYNPNYYGQDNVTYDGYLTDFNFYGFLVGRPFALDQLSKDKKLALDRYVGMHFIVDIEKGIQKGRYINSNGEVVPVCNMYYPDEPKEIFEMPLYLYSEE